jgi:hypothetical protein
VAIAEYILENESARAELNELAGRLDGAALKPPAGAGWTIAGVPRHLPFWDQRVLFLLRRWRKSGAVERSMLDSLSVAAINEAVNRLALEAPGPAAVTLALGSAAGAGAFMKAQL